MFYECSYRLAMAPQYEMAVGLKKGHKVTKLPKKARPSRRRGVSFAITGVQLPNSTYTLAYLSD